MPQFKVCYPVPTPQGPAITFDVVEAEEYHVDEGTLHLFDAERGLTGSYSEGWISIRVVEVLDG